MKTKYGLILLISVYFFFSCNTAIEEYPVYTTESANEDLATVSFNFENGRSIVSTVNPQAFTYTLQGTSGGETHTLCENISHSAFLAENFFLTRSDWAFTITAYTNGLPAYTDTKNVTLSSEQNTVSFTLHAVTEGTASISVKLNYPTNKGISKVTAKLYDTLPATDEGSELTLGTDSSATFTSSTVPVGVTKILKFYLYNSQNVCIGSYIESVYMINGDSINIIRSVTDVNSFAVTVNVTVANVAWNNSGLPIKAVKDNKQYALQAVANTNSFTASLPIGVYDIYNGFVDTGLDITISTSGAPSQTINYDSKFMYANVQNFDSVVSSLTSDMTIVVMGNYVNAFSEALINSTYNINLDLTQTTGLSSISGFPFWGCEKLTGIELPTSVTSIGESAFERAGLQSIEIPNSVTSIGERAFMYCENLESIVIGNSVSSIEASAFKYCTSLESIEFSNSVTTIGHYAFYHCESLESIEIPNGVESIANNTFAGCTNLHSVIIPNSVTSIASEAFGGCTSLESIVIPNSVTTLESYSFSCCTNLQTINYRGTPEQWNNINKATRWNYDCPSTMVINYNYQE